MGIIADDESIHAFIIITRINRFTNKNVYNYAIIWYGVNLCNWPEYCLNLLNQQHIDFCCIIVILL